MPQRSRSASKRGSGCIAEPLEDRRYLSLAFQPQQTFAVGNSLRIVVVADVNGDGRPDLVASNAGAAR